jgi:hypothetical protein
MMVERADPNIQKAAVKRDTAKVESTDIDPIMRGTVASETGLVGFEPIVVRGYGVVVGLRDTGSRQMPSDVRAFLTQELSKRGFGSGAPGAPKMSPQQLLNSSDTAVVIVEGVIPPGAPKGSKFDVRVTVAPSAVAAPPPASVGLAAYSDDPAFAAVAVAGGAKKRGLIPDRTGNRL